MATKPAIETLLHRALRAQRPVTECRVSKQPCRHLSQSRPSSANPLPITVQAPPPQPPEPSGYGTRIDERRKKAAMIQQSKEIRAQQSGSKSSPLRKRFWKDVLVKEAPEGYQISLDTRPVRTPTKAILTIPKSKPHLAHAIAIEWDLLTSAQQALKGHNIPMTSIVSRAQDIVEAESKGDTKIREEIIQNMMRYLDTDTLLCWAPSTAPTTFDLGKSGTTGDVETRPSLRQIQKETAEQIISYLNTTVWPGVEITPVLDENTIMPAQQSEVTRSIIRGWMTGLPPFELAGLERAGLATKSLLIGTRLLIEWSEEFRDLQRVTGPRFGIEEAAMAATIEVRWQTSMWGEVEDTHDVEKEDIRRQLGSAVLVISGHK